MTAGSHPRGHREYVPADVEGVAGAIRCAYERREAVLASGRGRHLDVGERVRRCDLLLRLERLDRVRAHEPADMTITVEAGCTLSALQQTLGAAGQWLPLDPPCPDETTVGGLIAADLSGPLRASQGTVRDHLLGLSVVGAGGVIVRGGGRVVKNVAGYDLPKMHVGALGTLGVVVEATFKVRPRFRAEQAVVLRARDLAEGSALALRLRDALEPTWLEVVHPAGLLLAGATGTLVIAGMGGAPAWVEQTADAAVRTAEAYDPIRHADGAGLRRDVADLVARPAAAIIRASVLPADVPGSLATAVDAALRVGFARDVTVHATAGVSRIAVAAAHDVPRLLDHLRASLPERSVVVLERSSPAVEVPAADPGAGGPAVMLMQRLKQSFDPARLFAPGRFGGET
ncbi:MAG TPA: FAD-binding oxidoreductase [Candidatus Limnocylindria bacterium]|nr:FAD-binding oxidoreductase [Candidatus Limnocylindria bacterium]